MTSWGTAALVAAVITNGLMAGLFAAYSYAVMPGLGRAGDTTFVEAMQQTNAAILNGWFGVCFGGSVVFTAAAVVLHLGRPGLPWIVAGLVLGVVSLLVGAYLGELVRHGEVSPEWMDRALELLWVLMAPG